MSTAYRWQSPHGYQQWGPKQFAVSWKSADLLGVLEMVARSLSEINSGQLWKHDARPRSRPDIHPAALELVASCTYEGVGGRQNGILMGVVLQPHRHLPQTGLMLTFNDQAMGSPWMTHFAESIVAQTVLHIGQSLYMQATGEILDRHPCEVWTIVMGSWVTPATIQHGKFWIDLA